MSDLIDRHRALINQIRWERDTAIAQLSQIGKGLGERMDDVEKVVRCKDCTNFTQGKDEWGSCFENPMKMWRETDFCSWGERRDDAD